MARAVGSGAVRTASLADSLGRKPTHVGFRLVPVALIASIAVSCASETARPDLAERWGTTASEYQLEILEDGTVSADEYGGAVAATAGCMEAAGFDTGPLRDVPDGVRKDFTVYPGGSSAADPDEDWGRCWDQHLVAVESVYLAQHASEAGPDAINRQLRDCLAAAGISDAPEAPTDFELFTLLRDLDASTEAWFCREKWLIALGELGAEPP